MLRKASIGMVVVLLALVVTPLLLKPRKPAADPTVCHGPRLTLPEREKAFEDGYEVHRDYGCITKASFEAMQKAEANHAAARAQREQQDKQRATQAAIEASRTLADVRRNFITGVRAPGAGQPLPTPPASLFVRSDYQSAGRTLAAFGSPNPAAGQRHPAIVWLTGGDSSTLDDFWTEGPAGRDQSASALRKAGVVMYFPTLRGGNQNAGQREFFMGEVDDVVAAADHLATLPYVDPQRIYLGGHSTGGTLAALAAEYSPRFAGVFAFGPVAEVTDYGPGVLPEGIRFDDQEARVRSPVHWLHAVQSPLWLIEGERGNPLNALCRAAAGQPKVRCLRVPGHDHFSVLGAVLPRLAAQIVVPPDGGIRLEAAELARAPGS